MPHRTTFPKARHGRFRNSNMLRELFEAVLRRCMAEDLVGGEAFAGDASLIKGDANRQRCVPRREDLPAAAGASRVTTSMCPFGWTMP